MSLFAELKRRNVFRVGAAYGVAGWLAIQVSDLVFPRLGLPDWTVTLVIVLVLIGLPVALVLAWALEVTPDGVKTDAEAAARASNARRRPVDVWIIAGLALVIALLVAERFWFAERGESAASVAAPAANAATDRSLVVLPFANLSDDPANEYFTDGLSEELMNVLTQAPALRVIGRTSSFAWKGRNEDLRTIGASLGVSHILEGSVRRQGNQVRITAQLIRAADGSHLWSQNYDRTLDDVFVVQDDIAANVLQALEIVLDDAQRQRMQSAGVRDVDAFVAYQKGYELWTRAHGSNSIAVALDAAVPYFDEAIARVPGFAAAHFLAADRYIHRLGAAPGFLSPEQQAETRRNLLASLTSIYETSRDPLRKAIVDVERVLASDDWRSLRPKVERMFSEPGCSRTLLAEVLMMLGYAKEAAQFYRREVTCDPQQPVAWWDLAMATFVSGDRPEAMRVLDEAERTLGEQSLLTAVRAQLMLADGRLDEARALAERVPIDQDLFGIALRSGVLAAAGRPDEAVALMESHPPALSEGVVDPRMLVYAAVGDREKANALGTEIDARPGGPALLVDYWGGLCACGLPFEMDAAPNLKARIAEAGVPWPPPTLIHYPAKNW